LITPIYILAIESSCDDTAAAVIRDGAPLSNCVTMQEIHRLYGGVVPEVASRAHQSNIIPVVHAALAQAGVAKHEIMSYLLRMCRSALAFGLHFRKAVDGHFYLFE
jgi:tRNA A37 threonylcarbamoyltransferase TsaD